MDPQLLYEIIGYAASVLIAISLMMRSILRLRILNLIGALFFTVYGLVIQAYPVAGVNFFIVLINIYYLYQIFSTREYFHLLPIGPTDSYLQYFLDFHKNEIRAIDPSFSFELNDQQWIFFSLRDLVPAGLFIAEQTGPDSLFVELDFVIPGYRDLKLGKFLYNAQKTGIFQERGIRTICSRPGNPIHTRYLSRMGFHPQRLSDGEPVYCLQVSGKTGNSTLPEQRGGST